MNPRRRRGARGAAPGTYRCTRCESRVTLFVWGVVSCSRCGRSMRRLEPDEGDGCDVAVVAG